MAQSEHRNAYFLGTNARRSYRRPSGSRRVFASVIKDINGSLDNAITAMRATEGPAKVIGGTVLPLDHINAQYISFDRALCTAVYSLGGGGSRQSGDLTRYSMSTGSISIPWALTSLSDSGNPVWDRFGRPDGEPYYEPTLQGMRKAFYQLQVPVWVITVDTVLEFNAADRIGKFLIRKINRNAVTFGTFRLGANQVRFDGANIIYQGDRVWPTRYQFSVLPFPWQRAVYLESGDPALQFMHDSIPFVPSDFPVAARTGIVT